MAKEAKTITVRPDSELAELLEAAGDTPLLLEKDGVRYRLDRAVESDTPLDRAMPPIPQGSVVARTAGIFKTDRPPLSAEELREVAEHAIAEEVIERMGGR